MELRQKVKDEIRKRLAEHMPEALETHWDTDAVLVVLEEIKFTPASGYSRTDREDWKARVSLGGVIRVELKNDTVDERNTQALIASLVKDQLFIDLPETAAEGELQPKMRTILTSWRDAVRDNMIVAALRLELEGHICEFSTAPEIPQSFEVNDDFRLTAGDAK